MSKRAKGPALPRIVYAGHAVLRQPARPLTPEEIRSPETQLLISTMVQVMRAAPGVGLAAPQIGLNLQIIVLEDQPSYIERLPAKDTEARERVPVPLTVIINPRLTLITDKEPGAIFREGCLSVPGYSAEVERAKQVVVDGLDAQGAPLHWEARGWPARILQHECDHLGGTLYIDKMRSRTFASER